MLRKRLLAVFAHPDDEAFGPAGTLARYADNGVEVQLLCATKGESGVWSDKLKHLSTKTRIETVREKELQRSANILGAKKVEFLGFKDGELRNNIYHQVAEKIINKINLFKPQVLLTNERRGVSGHLDHIAISMITTYSFLKTKFPLKLYYNCVPKEMRDKMMDDYFVYFPEGYSKNEITTRVDFSNYWDIKVKSMLAHQSQIGDVKNVLKRWEKWPKIDNFILQFHRGITVKLPETDLFAGIGH